MNWRWAARRFDPTRDVSFEDVDRLVKLATRSPSGMNMEPWRAVVVRSKEGRQRLASGMVGSNSSRVLDAPVSIVLLADLEAMRDIDHVVEREARAGRSEEYLERLPAQAAYFAGGALGKAGDAIRLGANALLSCVSTTAFPTAQTADAWANKQVGIATGVLLVGAAARGLAACPMEGFDAARVRSAIGASERWQVSVVVSLGFVPDSGTSRSVREEGSGTSPRRAVQETIRLESLHRPWSVDEDSWSERH
jgi:nitroreductase / dihydropteridine reductase